jgi:translation initiation factor IF-2
MKMRRVHARAQVMDEAVRRVRARHAAELQARRAAAAAERAARAAAAAAKAAARAAEEKAAAAAAPALAARPPEPAERHRCLPVQPARLHAHHAEPFHPAQPRLLPPMLQGSARPKSVAP